MPNDVAELRFTRDEAVNWAAYKIKAAFFDLNQRGDGRWLLVSFAYDEEASCFVARFERKRR